MGEIKHTDGGVIVGAEFDADGQMINPGIHYTREQWNELQLKDEITRLRTDVERLTKERDKAHSVGWLYHNPDTGIEFHEDHPVKSGMVEDATEIRAATAEDLKDALIDAWRALDEHRQAEGEWTRKCHEERTKANDAIASAQSAEDALAEMREALRKADETLEFYEFPWQEQVTVPDFYSELNFGDRAKETRSVLRVLLDTLNKGSNNL